MKKYFIAIIGAALLATAAQAQTLDRSIRPKPGPAPKIELGKTESFTLPNGLRVFVVENHKVPLVSVSLQLDIRPELQGSMAGFHDIVGELITSGTKSRSKDQLDLAIDNIGATIRADEESMFGTCLTRNEAQLIALMSDMILNPNFKQTELDKLKKQSLSGLAAQKNDPDAMLNNLTQAVNYGPAHPYGEVATDKTVESITLKRCTDYFSTYWRPNVAYMAFVGDVTPATVKQLIEKYFAGWKKANVPVAKYTLPAPIKTTDVAFANRDAAVQSVFNVTYPVELQPNSPDVIKARVANAVLGGGSQGRLFLNLREAHGWTYGSYSSIRQDELIGSFTAYAKCRNLVTDSAITQTLSEMSRLRSDEVPQEDLQNIINNMTGQFAINLESPQTVAQFAINTERYHLPKDYYATYLQKLAAVSATDVKDIAGKYIRPEAAHIVVVGNADQVAKSLEQFGKISYYDNYGRPTTSNVKVAAPAGITPQAVLQKYVAALGGESAVKNLKDMKLEYSFEPQPGVTVVMSVWKNGKNMKRTVTAMGQTFQKEVYANGKGTQEAQGQSKEMDADELAEAAEEADLQSVLHPEKYGTKYTVAGIEKVNGKDAYVMTTENARGEKGKEYYDVASGLLVKTLQTKQTPQGEMSISTEYSDYREVPGSGGYKVPYVLKQQVGPQAIDSKLEKVEINKGIPDSEFQ
jgi:predicted Zn-dependent peptidase